MTYGSLFAGIGGFDLGLERAGMTCQWQVEIDPYARRVLEKHWPNVRRWDDVRTWPHAARLDDRYKFSVDVICGGFPCQDISNAGKRVGICGDRSGLWGEFARIIRDLRPKYVIVENVPALLVRGMDRVLGDFSALRYNAEWVTFPASSFGAKHLRIRTWIVAYPHCLRKLQPERSFTDVRRRIGDGGEEASDATSVAERKPANKAHAESTRRESRDESGGISKYSPYPYIFEANRVAIARRQCGNWLPEPSVGRVADGVPARMDRLRCLGNAVVPQVTEWIGRLILEADAKGESP